MSTVATQRNCHSFLQCAVIITASCYDGTIKTINLQIETIICPAYHSRIILTLIPTITIGWSR